MRFWGILGVLAGLLAGGPASAGTYWVSPVGNANNDGGDSTKFRARTLAWANANATAGDTIYLKSSFGVETDTCCGIPQYNAPIRPTHSGTSDNARVWYIGDVNVPGSRVVTAVQIDSTAGANKYISVRGVRAAKTTASNGGLSLSGGCVTARYDSVSHCIFDGGLSVSGRSYATVDSCTIGTGNQFAGQWQSSDVVSINGFSGSVNCSGTASSDSAYGNGAWLTGFTLSNCTVKVSVGPPVGANAMTMRLVRGSTFRDNHFTLRTRGAYADGSLFTSYYSQNNEYTDNTFLGYSESPGGAMYLLNVRDWQRRNRWRRNFFLEDLDSPARLKVEMMTSGNPDSLPARPLQATSTSPCNCDPGSGRNLWDGNFVRVRSYIGYQDRSSGDTLQFNTFLGEEQLQFGNTGTTAKADSLVFRHNTVVGYRADGRTTSVTQDVDTTSASRFTKNIFASMSTATNHYHHHIINGRGTSSADSNLYFCKYLADSAEVKSDAYGLGPTSVIGYCNSVGRECASHFDDPEFTDESWGTFDGYPGATSIAISSDLWGTDGYVGARGPSADGTVPSVTITSPVDDQLLALGASTPIEWTCSDNVGVARIDVDRGVVGAGEAVTWYTIKHDIAGTATSWFFVPTNTRYTHTKIRVTVYDAAGNSASDTVEVIQPCQPCSEDDPFLEEP